MNRPIRLGLLAAFLLFLTLSPLPAPAAEGSSQRFDGNLSHALQVSFGLAVSGFQRQEIVPGIGHYSFRVKVGPRERDEIRVHRIVEERAPFIPERRSENVFFVHGILNGFVSTFLSSTLTDAAPDERALPVFLAQRGIDVWGMDLRFALVPQDVPDDRFMEDWSLDSDLQDIRVGLGTARALRLLTGSGYGRLNYLGYSRGARLGYPYLDSEVERPLHSRHVEGFIALDGVFLPESEATRLSHCATVGQLEALQAEGAFAEDTRFLSRLGELAAVDPEGASPLIPGLTNRQAALFFATVPSSSGFHGAAGTFDVEGLPTGLVYSEEAQLNALLQESRPFQPLQSTLDLFRTSCGEVETGYADSLGDVTVPALYVGAGGGNDTRGVASIEALGSTDVTVEIVRLLPPEEKVFDIGHLDVVVARNAPELFWTPIAEWILAR